ncbi:MAG: hypothetical protein J7K75_06565 [Desulfuromonas sp.]|nr:hypothetical protein [Desulfuromonas sp.]
MKSLQILLCALLVSVLLAVSGCGNVGPVKPLQKALPQAVDNVSLQQKGNALLLSWDIPTQNQDGSPLEDLEGFAIYKSDYDLAKACPECRPPKNLLRQVDLAYYRSSNRDSNRIHLWDSAVEEDSGYRYKIVPYTKGGHNGESVLLHRPCFTAPFPPAELSGEGLDKQVRLNWLAADEERQGAELLGYNLYRRSGTEYFAAKPLNTELITALNYDDFQVKNGTEYSYALRTVIRIGEQQLESSLSAMVTVQPVRP